jgi:hypothetical protein
LRGKGGDLTGGEAFHEPGLAEVGDGRHEDEDFGKHDECRRQQKQLGGQAEMKPQAPVAGARFFGLPVIFVVLRTVPEKSQLGNLIN